MRFNYMLPKHESIIEASLGHVAVRFHCRHCGEITTAFLTNEEYKINENLLKKYGE